jgi:phytoene synthase
MNATYRHSTWEHHLLLRAYEAWQPAAIPAESPAHDRALLDDAYACCDAITAEHSHSFYLATRLLPPDKRRSVRALYAFCRVSDNLVDCPGANVAAQLAAWRARALSSEPPPDDRVAIAWADTRRRYRIPLRYAEQLIEGVACDLHYNRYRTFDDLAAYAYGVASTVGLMSMYIIGFTDMRAIRYAIKLGVALQITNILRDVGEDWRAGRVYLPQEELAAFNLSEADLAAGQVDDRWRDFMRFQIERNRRLYGEAWRGIAMLNRDGRFAIAAAGDLYRAILSEIEANDYDVFNCRAHVGTWDKLRRLPRIWWDSR